MSLAKSVYKLLCFCENPGTPFTWLVYSCLFRGATSKLSSSAQLHRPRCLCYCPAAFRTASKAAALACLLLSRPSPLSKFRSPSFCINDGKPTVLQVGACIPRQACMCQGPVEEVPSAEGISLCKPSLLLSYHTINQLTKCMAAALTTTPTPLCHVHASVQGRSID
jgi:hypothetical protein